MYDRLPSLQSSLQGAAAAEEEGADHARDGDGLDGGDDAPEHRVDGRVVEQQPGPAAEEVVGRAQRGARVPQPPERGHEAATAHHARR